MLFTHTLLVAAGIASVAAAPAPAPAPIEIGLDDVILYGNGRTKVMKRAEYDELEKLRNSPVPPPAPVGWDGKKLDTSKLYVPNTLQSRSDETGNRTVPDVPLYLRHGKRKISKIVIPGPTSDFLGWDVLISGVVRGSPTSVYVSSGFSLENSITEGITAGAAEVLSIGASIQWGKTWTTTTTNTYIAPVPKGKYGAFVSNPKTHRITGHYWEGTIGGGGTYTPYQGDSFKSAQKGDLAWVDGLISLCVKDTYPLTRCLGSGELS